MDIRQIYESIEKVDLDFENEDKKQKSENSLISAIGNFAGGMYVSSR